MVQDAQAPTGFDADAEPIAYINGKRHVLPAGRAEVTLLQYLRGAELSLVEPRPGQFLALDLPACNTHILQSNHANTARVSHASS